MFDVRVRLFVFVLFLFLFCITARTVLSVTRKPESNVYNNYDRKGHQNIHNLTELSLLYQYYINIVKVTQPVSTREPWPWDRNAMLVTFFFSLFPLFSFSYLCFRRELMRSFGNSWPDIPCWEIVAQRMNRVQRSSKQSSTSLGSRKGTQLGQVVILAK